VAHLVHRPAIIFGRKPETSSPRGQSKDLISSLCRFGFATQ
jgi:hypothetical protein